MEVIMITRRTFSLLFLTRKSKLLKNGEVPVYLRITVNGKSKELALKRSIAPGLWDAKNGKQIGQPWLFDSAILSLAFSPDGNFLLSGSYGKVELLNTNNGIIICKRSWHHF